MSAIPLNVAWALAGAAMLCGVWLLWRGVFGRWTTGTRCRCGYSMEGARRSPESACGLVCPECGRRYKSADELGVRRRSWRAAVVGVVICQAWILPVELSRVSRGGWVAAIPTTAMVVAPGWLPDEAMADGVRGKEDWSLSGRLERGEIGEWHTGILADRLARLARGGNAEEVLSAMRLARLIDKQVYSEISVPAGQRAVEIMAEGPSAERRVLAEAPTPDGVFMTTAITAADISPHVGRLVEVLESTDSAAVAFHVMLTMHNAADAYPSALPATQGALERFHTPRERNAAWGLIVAISRTSDEARVFVEDAIANGDVNRQAEALRAITADSYNGDAADVYFACYEPLIDSANGDVALWASAAASMTEERASEAADAIAAALQQRPRLRGTSLRFLLDLGPAARPHYGLVLDMLRSSDADESLAAARTIAYCKELEHPDYVLFVSEIIDARDRHGTRRHTWEAFERCLRTIGQRSGGP